MDRWAAESSADIVEAGDRRKSWSIGRRYDRDVANFLVGPGSYHQDCIGFQVSDAVGPHCSIFMTLLDYGWSLRIRKVTLFPLLCQASC